LSYSKTVHYKTKAATVIVMHDGTFSDHTAVSMWKFMDSASKMGCMTYEHR